MENKNLIDISYPSEEEMRAAQLACCGRLCKMCEAPTAYAWRKREVDMSLLLEKAIENELTENEKSIIKDKWYNSLSFSQIAANRGISPAAVKQTSDRALKKLEKVLQYVVFYQRDIMDESIVPAAVGNARVILSARKNKPDKIGQRICALRVGSGFSVKAFSMAVSVPIKRIEEIERGCMPSVEEIICLSEFFAVTSDYLLKGENNG